MPRDRLLLLAGLTVAAALAFLLLAPRGSWSFLIPFRGERLLALALVGGSIGVATVLFQTVAGNRILTPSIMGFDALYLMFQTVLVFVLGGIGYATLNPQLKFLIETAAMIAVAVSLLGLLLGRGRTDLHRMLLVGVIIGTLLRSMAGFLQRLMDPNAFAVVQGASFASFSRVRTDLLFIALALTAIGIALAWRRRHDLDVLALGRSASIGLGMEYDRVSRLTLAIVALLVSVSTALVGPFTSGLIGVSGFFGLLVASLAHVIIRSPHHGHLLPAAAMLGAIMLIAGQTLFERALGMQATLSVVVEFAGGLLFLFLLLRGKPV